MDFDITDFTVHPGDLLNRQLSINDHIPVSEKLWRKNLQQGKDFITNSAEKNMQRAQTEPQFAPAFDKPSKDDFNLQNADMKKRASPKVENLKGKS